MILKGIKYGEIDGPKDILAVGLDLRKRVAWDV